VLLSMRDDFLIRCHEHKPARAGLPEGTPILPLGGEGLRRALVEPANGQGFAFEDESLVAEMLEAVEGTRGALPLLAFAVSRLWEKRDRERKLLTRAAYEETGGVAGALAQHAEQTLERIGSERELMVRELFRNLVTAQWTRAAADREDLLSVLPDREAGAEVLDLLIDARLLTSYEVRDDVRSGAEGVEPKARHRIEIVHESLLRAWPRLVRWQAQDEEGAVLRDQLRQAAHLWEEKGRPEDLLWTGTSEREFELWQTRYPGTLTALEGDFARAMLDRARRRRRRRRVAVASTMAALLVVLAVIGAFWRRSVAEARRAEAAQLLSLAQQRLPDHPSEALAYATASLELADRPEVRELALDALGRGPVEIRTGIPASLGIDFSPDGRWMVAKRDQGGELFKGGSALWPSDGGAPVPLEGSEVTMEPRFSPRGDLVAGQMDSERLTIGVWSVPDGRLLRTFRVGARGAAGRFSISPDSRRLLTCRQEAVGRGGLVEYRVWPVDGGESRLLARLEIPPGSVTVAPSLDLAWTRLAWADGARARVARLEGERLDAAAAVVVDHGAALFTLVLDDRGRTLLTGSDGGRMLRIWSLERDTPRLVRTLVGPDVGDFRFDSSGSSIASSTWLSDLAAPPDAEPLRLQGCNWAVAFHPDGRWVATRDGASCSQASLWPLTRRHPRVFTGHAKAVMRLAFVPDGRRLVSTALDGSIRLWVLDGNSGERSRILYRTEGAYQWFPHLAMAPDGSFVVAGNNTGQVVVVSLDRGPARELAGFSASEMIAAVAVGHGGRLVAAGAGVAYREEALVRVWDLQTGEVRLLDAGDGAQIDRLRFTGDDGLLVWSGGGSAAGTWPRRRRGSATRWISPKRCSEAASRASPATSASCCSRRTGGCGSRIGRPAPEGTWPG
jgi:WD40 repeat protein